LGGRGGDNLQNGALLLLNQNLISMRAGQKESLQCICIRSPCCSNEDTSHLIDCYSTTVFTGVLIGP